MVGKKLNLKELAKTKLKVRRVIKKPKRATIVLGRTASVLERSNAL